MQAILFAAGPAQRLLPLTENRPKGMLLVGGKPLLQHAIEALAAHGVKRVVMVVGHHGEKIQAFFKDGADFGVEVEYAHQAEPTGTMAAVKVALAHIDASLPAWILPGHAVVSGPLLAGLAKARSSSLLVASAGADHLQGIPSVKGNRLHAMRHGVPRLGSTRVTTNILRAHPDLLEVLASGDLDDHQELDLALGAWCESGGKVTVLETDLGWHTLVEPWDVLRINEDLLAGLKAPATGRSRNRRGAVVVGDDTHIADTAVIQGPVIIGSGCHIGDFTVIGPYVSIRNNTVVGSHCEVRRSVLNNNVHLDSHSMVRGSILDDGVRVGAGFLCAERADTRLARGCIIGRDSDVDAGSFLPGGTILAAESQLAGRGN